ncbi:MAG: hypothetical protein ABSE45_06100, partial [Candidatus Acidiferrales bacterium]
NSGSWSEPGIRESRLDIVDLCEARKTDRGHPRLPGPFAFVDDVLSLRIATSTLAHGTDIRNCTEVQKFRRENPVWGDVGK